jgi:hypothetical protein
MARHLASRLDAAAGSDIADLGEEAAEALVLDELDQLNR